MRQTKKRLFALALVLWTFSSCNQEARDMEGSATEGETVSFSFDAEVSVDDSELRAIDYKLGKNVKNQLVPLPQFTDKQEVEVHTILKSSRGASVAKTLKWRYDATKKKLVLKQTDGHSITVPGFNNDNSTKWYISGLIGGALNGTKVEFMGTRVVKGVVGNAGDALGSMEVPYAFGWTELTINTKSTKDSQGSYKYAEVPKSKSVQFKPLGSMLAVKLGTNQRAGAYTFRPKGFVLSSNAWGDQGSFELDTDIPTSNPHKVLPIWSEAPCTMYYTFASGEVPGTIAHNRTTAKTYYVWVMPHKAVPTGIADVRVMLKGTSSRPVTATYKDYTNTWFTDYTAEGKATQGKVTQGRVHSLTAKASHRVALPIEYVMEYNLAGGEGLTYTVEPGKRNDQLNSPAFGGVQPDGITGPLRFATSHRNDQSGYYNWYKVVGRHHATYNPDTRNLQTEVEKAFGVGNYFIPTMEHWWGIYPSALIWSHDWFAARERSNARELMRVGLDGDILRQVYLSDYSLGFTSPLGGDNETDDAVFYAIRFKARTNDCSPVNHAWDYDAATKTNRTYTYMPAPDNSMKCAYRFRRVGGAASWEQSKNMNLTSQLIIDVVYLGEESSPTDLATISDESWWSAKATAGLVISKTFPAVGQIYSLSSSFVSGLLGARGLWGGYWSSSQKNASDAWYVYLGKLSVSGNNALTLFNGFPVRFFTRRNH